MAGRRLDPGEAALWARVVSGVRPLHLRVKRAPVPVAEPPPAPPPAKAKPAATRAAMPQPPRPKMPAPAARRADTLDGSWDRRIARGEVMPDATLDLHGHSLASAHAMLDHGLGAAIARGDRVLLLVTGRPPRPESERPFARGAIRAAVGDWIAASRHVGRIAAIRGAHPRHGGQGALYVVFRRPVNGIVRKS